MMRILCRQKPLITHNGKIKISKSMYRYLSQHLSFTRSILNCPILQNAR